MMNLALFLISMNAAQARDVTHYIAVCGNGKVMMTCTQPFCDSTTAKPKAKKICANQKGFSELVVLQGPRNAQEALISEVKQAVAQKQRAERYVKAKAEEDRLREEARKAEELRLQEEARKAEEARRVAAAREAEVRDCNAQLTYIPQVWACPFGDYVADPNECSQLEGMTRSGDHAVQVDLGYRILPPGVSCPLVAGKADVSHERLHDHVLGRANFAYSGKERPEGFDFDVETPVKQAYANWRKAEDRWLAAIPYDCLAGVCLNAPATRIADKLVTVSEVVMHRKVEVCSGRVVRVEVSAGWVSPTFNFANIAVGAEVETYGDDMRKFPTSHAEQIAGELETMGWILSETIELDPFSWKFYVSPAKKGLRDIMLLPVEDSWRVDLQTIHPDKDALCAHKRQQGL